MNSVEIYHSSNGKQHWFRLNKNGATLADVKNAAIIEKNLDQYRAEQREPTQRQAGEIIFRFVPGIFLLRRPRLEFDVYDPYGSDKMQARAGRKGIGLHFELKVLKYLKEKLVTGNVKIRHNTIRPHRVQMLEELGIKPKGSNLNLDQHIEKYETRIAEIEARLKHG